MRKTYTKLVAVLLVALSAGRSGAALSIQTLSDSHGQYYLVNNSALSNFQLYTTGSLAGKITAITYDGQQMVGSKGLYYDIQGSPNIYLGAGESYSYRTGSNFIDISAFHPATAAEPLDVTWHWILRDGESAFSTYLTYHHTTAMADWGSNENRMGAEFFNGSLFHYSSITDNYWGYQSAGDANRNQGRYITDETSDMRGVPSEYTKSYETKYDWRATYAQAGGVTGIVTAANTSAATVPMVANDYGIWTIDNYRSYESWNAGPTHPQTTVADGASMIPSPPGSHFGGPTMVFTGNMDKAFGPILTYFNKNTNINTLRADAKKYTTGPSSVDLNSFYDSLHLPSYANTSQRGAVSGKVRLADGSSMDGATVILSTFNSTTYSADPISQEYQRRADGYNYWVTPNKDGSFNMPDVRPGTYRVTVIKPGNYREGTWDNITVAAGTTTNTGNLTWQPDIKGRGGWQVGTFDRTAGEFKRGNEYNNWIGTFDYNKDFPSGVSYTVSSANPYNDTQNWRNNWGLNQTNPDQDFWSVNFNLATAPAANSNVTITLAVADQQFINDIAALVYKTGNTSYNRVDAGFDHSADNAPGTFRSGDTSSRVLYRKLTFPGSWLHAGDNKIAFHIVGGNMQWDAIRLDIQDPGTFSVAQWNGGNGNWTDATQWKTQPYGYTSINKGSSAIGNDTSTTFADGATSTAPINNSSSQQYYDAVINGGTVNLSSSLAVQRFSLLEGSLNVTSGTPTLTASDVLTLGGGTFNGTGTILAQSTTTVNFANTISGGAHVTSIGAVNWTDGGTVTVTGNGSIWNPVSLSFGQEGPSALTINNSGQVLVGIAAAGTVTVGAQGTVAISGGTLTTGGINNSGVFNSTAGTISVGAGVFTNSGTATIDGGLAGASVVNNSGSLTLGGTNTYTGATTVNGGVVQFAAATSIGGSGASVTVNAGGAATFAPGITDSAFLSRLNTASTGALALTSADAATNLDFTAATLATFSNMAVGAVGNVTYTGTYTPAGNLYRLGGGGGTLTYSPIISGTASVQIGNTGTSGTVILNAANSYSGATRIKGGILSVSSLANGGANSPIGSSSSAAANLIIDGGTLAASGAASTNRLFTIGSAGAALDGSGGAMSWTGALPITASGSGNRTLTLTGSNVTNSFSPAVVDPASGITSLTKDGAGTWTINSATHTYSGDTTVLAGTLKLGPSASIPSGTGKGNLVVALNSTFDLNGNDLAINGLNDGPAPAGGPGPNGNGGGTISNSSGTKSLTLGNGNANGQFSGVISGGVNLAKAGSGTQILSGDNTYSGTTTISAGTLQVGVGGTPLSTGPGDGGFRGKLGSGNIINNATLVFNRGYYTTCTNVISGTGTLKQIANAELVLGSANTYTGPTVIGGGIANIGQNGSGLAYTGDCSLNASVLANGGVASSIGMSTNAASNLVLDGGTLFYSSTSARSTDRLFTVTQNGGAIYTSGALTFSNGGAIAMSGTGDRTLSLGGDSSSASTFSCDIGDPSSGKTFLTKDRSATWIISSSAALTYSGDTTLLMGKLQLGSGAALPFGAGKGNVVFGTSTDFGTDFSAILELSGNDLNINGLSGGTVNGTFVSTVDNNVGGLRTFTVGNANASATFNGILSGTLNLAKTGTGTQIVTGANTYTGTTTISGGTLQFGNATASGSVGSGGIIDNATLVFNRTDSYTVANQISGSGALTQAGAGTLILSGSNTFSGLTKAAAGTLQLGNSLALQNSTLDYNSYGGSLSFGTLAAATLGGLSGNQALALINTTSAAVTLTVGNNGANTSYSGNLSGVGSLVKSGAGTLILSGANTFTGSTRINQGILQLGTSNRLADASPLVLAGGTLASAGFNETMNTLSLLFNSKIDLGSGTSILHFTDSHAFAWNGILAINNWDGTWGPNGVSSAGKVFLGSTNTGLTAAQLAEISFTGYAPGAVILPTGELVPINPMKGDFDISHTLNSADLAVFEQALCDVPGYEASHGLTSADFIAIGDFDEDGTVSNSDLQGLIFALQHPASAPAQEVTADASMPTSPVPEPSAMVLAWCAMGIGLFVIRRKQRRTNSAHSQV